MASQPWSRARRIGWRNAVCVAGLGLYLGRAAAEALPGARSLGEAALLTLAGLALAALAGAALRRWRLPVAPLALLWAYALWPHASPSVAFAVGLAALIVWIWFLPGARLPKLAVEGAMLLIGLALYGATVAPTVLPADSGEFQIVTAVLGIAHPPGYALYTMLGALATLVPVGDVAYRLNLLSVLFGALTLAGIAALVQVVATPGRPRGWAWAGALAAMALAVSPTYWSQATTANIRSLTALFTALCLLLAARWAQRPTVGRLAALGLATGLAIGHHTSLGLMVAPLGAYLLACDPRLLLSPRRWLPALGAFLASFMVLLYLPLRSAMRPAFDPVPINSVSRFFEHVLAFGFRGDMFYFRTAPELVERARTYLNILQLQFGAMLPWAMVLSLAWVLVAKWRLGLLLGSLWVLNAITALTYRAPQTVEYLLPSYVAMAASLGCGLALALERLPRWGSAAVLACLGVAVAWNGLAVWPDFRALHTDRNARRYAETILEQAPPDALVLANWHWYTPLLYLQQVEGLRPDLSVEYVYPEGALANEAVWLARIAASLDAPSDEARPVVVTNRFKAFEAAPYLFEPLGEAWLVRPRPPDAPSQNAIPLGIAMGERVRLEGYRLDVGQLAPGDTLRVVLYWRPTVALERDYAVFVQLVGPQGVVGQADRAQPTSTYAVGALRVDVYDLPLLLQTPPGEYALIAGFYTAADGGWERLPTAQGADHALLGVVEVVAGTCQAATTRRLAARYETGLRLRGMDLDRGVPGQTRLYLHWVSEADAQAHRVTAYGDGQPLAATTLPALARGQTATIALDLPDVARVRLRLEDGGTQAARVLGPWGRAMGTALTLRLPPGPVRYVPLGGRMVYLGLQGGPQPAVAGQPVAIRPRFMALRPLLRDYSVSVGLLSAEPPWERKDDGTPAMGAIPTLKWLTGWIVEAPYAPTPPADAPPGRAQITVSVYDAFTLAPLAVLDERLAAKGQGIFLVADEIAVAGR